MPFPDLCAWLTLMGPVVSTCGNGPSAGWPLRSPRGASAGSSSVSPICTPPSRRSVGPSAVAHLFRAWRS